MEYQELKGFAKTRELKPGESQTLTIQLQKRDLASFDEANSRWLAEAGQYTFEIARCIGACGLAPAMMVDNDVYKQVNPAKVPAILSRYEETEAVEGGAEA